MNSGPQSRVLHVVHWSNGGLSKLVQDICAHGVGASAMMMLVLVDNGGDLRADVQVVKARGSGFLAQARALRLAIRDFRPTVLHVHSFTPLLLAACCAPRSLPVIRTVHNNYPYFTSSAPGARIKRRVEGWLQSMRGVRVVAISDDVARRAPWRGLPMEVIDNGIDFAAADQAAGASFEVRPAEHGDSLVIVCVGRLEEQKNVALLLHAFAAAQRATPGALRLWLVGSGSQREALQALAKDLGVAGQVEFLGHVKNPYPYLKAANLYASCSRYEGFNLALVEAMALGLPAVATRSGGVTESLASGSDLLIVDEHTPEAVARAFGELLGDEARRRQIASQGMQRVRSRFSIARMVGGYGDLYQNASHAEAR